MALAREMLQEAMDGFFLAAEHGRSDVIKALVDHGQGRIRLDDIVDPKTGRTPLHVAVANGKTDAVRVLLAAGFAPDHESLLESDAYEAQDQDTTEVLPPPERDPDVAVAVVVPGRRTPYALAQKLQAMDLVFVFHQFIIQQIAVNDVARVQRLLVAGIPVTMTDGIAQNTLLHWAVSCKANEVLAYLLELQQVQERALVNQCNADGATPLHLACRANQADCVQILLKHHADASIVGQNGYCKDKRAVDLSTSTAVMVLFDTPVAPLPEEVEVEEQAAAGPKRKSSSAPASVRGNQSVESDVGDSSIRRRRSATTDYEQQIRRLLLQLEEKDLLVSQLKKTIETLVVESQEIHKLGEEGCVLDYVRKLRQVGSPCWHGSRRIAKTRNDSMTDCVILQNPGENHSAAAFRRCRRPQQGPAAADPRPQGPNSRDERPETGTRLCNSYSHSASHCAFGETVRWLAA